MQFNDETNNSGIVQHINFLAETNNTAYPLKDKTRNVNNRMRIIWGWIFNSTGGWLYDDTNQLDLPQATATLTSGTATYALDAEAINLRGVEVKDEDGNWHVLSPITLKQIQERQAVDEFLDSDNRPEYYRLVGRTIELFPAPNYTQAASLKLYFDREGVAFTADGTDTTKEPGFVSLFHPAVAVGAALDWVVAKGNRERQVALEREWLRYEELIRTFYAKRFTDMFPAKIKVRDSVRDNQ